MSWFYKYFLCGGFGLFFYPTVAELTGDTHLYFPPVKHMRVSPTVRSVGCQCWNWISFLQV